METNLSGGEVEVRPELPGEGMERVVSTEALLAPSRGGVLGRRSGRPDCIPVQKEKKERQN